MFTFNTTLSLCISVCQFAADSGALTLISVLKCSSAGYVTSALDHARIPTVFVLDESCDTLGIYNQLTSHLSTYVTHNVHNQPTSQINTYVTVGRSHVVRVIKSLIAEHNSERIIIFYDQVNGM